eukprot:1486816-Pyramimonas_sp.AAC.1
MPVKVTKEVNFTDRVDLNPQVEKMKHGIRTLVKGQLHSLQRDLGTVGVKLGAYLKEFGPSF